MNARRVTQKEDDHARKMNQKHGGRQDREQRERMAASALRNQVTSWPGYVVCGVTKVDGLRTALLYDKPPRAATDVGSGKSTRDEEARIRVVREEDLILLTTEKIPGVWGDLKQKINRDLMTSILDNPNCMLAYATKKYEHSAEFLELVIHEKYEDRLRELEEERSFAVMHCYHFESLSTMVREYRTLSGIEFSRLAPLLLQPTLSLSMKGELLKEYGKTVNVALGKDLAGTDASAKKPSIWAKTPAPARNVEADQQEGMKVFLEKNAGLFNDSQFEVLQRVTKMYDNDILLIQGPVSNFIF